MRITVYDVEEESREVGSYCSATVPRRDEYVTFMTGFTSTAPMQHYRVLTVRYGVYADGEATTVEIWAKQVTFAEPSEAAVVLASVGTK